jgi:hypothetical protein
MGHSMDMFKRIIQNESLRKNNRKFSHFKNAALLQAERKPNKVKENEDIFTDEQKYQLEQELKEQKKLDKRKIFIKIVMSVAIAIAVLVVISQILLWAFF